MSVYKIYMKTFTNFLYYQNPLKYIIILLLLPIIVMTYYHFDAIEIALDIFCELAFIVVISLFSGLLMDGQENSKKQYMTTIYIQKNQHYEKIQCRYFNHYSTAKISVNIQIWLMHHFEYKNDPSAIIYTISYY